ncbi:MAG: hypothetical protein PUC73_06655 [Lachnospiraceae bacterium]|nr:hypothetical protein [Lachnospiraceae bacterium]
MDISEKKTALDDSASIYQRREEKTERAKWKELKGFKAKWEHFRAYYLLKTFIWVCVIAFVGYAVYEMFAPEKERLLYVSILDAVILDTEISSIQAGYEEYISFDEETQEVLFDNTVMISNSADAVSAQKFTTHAFVGEIDIIIARESVLKQYAGSYLRPLSEQLPADLYEALSERFCYARPRDEEGNWGEEQPYGIIISDFVEKNPYYDEPVALAICGNSKHEKNAEEFVRYLLEYGTKSKETAGE